MDWLKFADCTPSIHPCVYWRQEPADPCDTGDKVGYNEKSRLQSVHIYLTIKPDIIRMYRKLCVSLCDVMLQWLIKRIKLPKWFDYIWLMIGNYSS